MKPQAQLDFFGYAISTPASTPAASYDDSYDHIYSATADELVEKLLESYKYLQMANYRIGYLESLLDNYRQQTKHLGQLQDQSQKAQQLASENTRMRDQLPDVLTKVRLVETLENENHDLRQQLAEFDQNVDKIGDTGIFQFKAQLMKSEEILGKLWPQFSCLILGEPGHDSTGRHNSACSMNDYYTMLQQRLKK